MNFAYLYSPRAMNVKVCKNVAVFAEELNEEAVSIKAILKHPNGDFLTSVVLLDLIPPVAESLARELLRESMKTEGGRSRFRPAMLDLDLLALEETSVLEDAFEAIRAVLLRRGAGDPAFLNVPLRLLGEDDEIAAVVDVDAPAIRGDKWLIQSFEVAEGIVPGKVLVMLFGYKSERRDITTAEIEFAEIEPEEARSLAHALWWAAGEAEGVAP